MIKDIEQLGIQVYPASINIGEYQTMRLFMLFK